MGAVTVQPYASSSPMRQPSRQPRPSPPYSSGTCVLTRPSSHALSKTGRGNSMVRSYSAATGITSSCANLRACQWWWWGASRQ